MKAMETMTRKPDEARSIYTNKVYGHFRGGEKVSYVVNKVSRREKKEDPSNPFLALFLLSTDDDGTDVEIHVEKDGKSVFFTVRAYLPKEEMQRKEGNPFIVCMHPIQPKQFALDNGYALIFMDTSMVAADNCKREGCFYDLYPYDEKNESSQTGELMAWSWAASKVLDAVYNGLDRELNLRKDRAMVTGVSRWGKATAVCGAYEKRFFATVPVCSGAGGLALWNVNSEGKSYDLSSAGGPQDYVYGKNEPLESLTSDDERGWFIEEFRKYKSYDEIPVEQYMLPVLAADADRYYFIVAAWMKEDWVNAPAMWECFLEAKKEYEKLGLSNHIFAHFHKEGHAVLEEDLQFIFDTLKSVE